MSPTLSYTHYPGNIMFFLRTADRIYSDRLDIEGYDYLDDDDYDAAVAHPETYVIPDTMYSYSEAQAAWKEDYMSVIRGLYEEAGLDMPDHIDAANRPGDVANYVNPSALENFVVDDKKEVTQ